MDVPVVSHTPPSCASLPDHVARAVVFIALYRKQHGQGPTWKAVNRACGLRLRKHQLHDLMFEMRANKVVEFDRTPGSLRPRQWAVTQAVLQTRAA